MVVRLDPSRLIEGGIPPALAATLLHVPTPPGVNAWALVCLGRTCLPPILDAGALLESLEHPIQA